MKGGDEWVWDPQKDCDNHRRQLGDNEAILSEVEAVRARIGRMESRKCLCQRWGITEESFVCMLKYASFSLIYRNCVTFFRNWREIVTLTFSVNGDETLN